MAHDSNTWHVSFPRMDVRSTRTPRGARGDGAVRGAVRAVRGNDAGLLPSLQVAPAQREVVDAKGMSRSGKGGQGPASSRIRSNLAAVVLVGLALAGLERLPCLIGGLAGTRAAASSKAVPPEMPTPCHAAGMPSTKTAAPVSKGCSHCSHGHQGLLSLSRAKQDPAPPASFVVSTLLRSTQRAQRLGSPSSFRARTRKPDTLARTAVRLL